MARKPNRRERRAKREAASNQPPCVEKPSEVDVAVDEAPPVLSPLERIAKVDAEISGLLSSTHPRWVKFARLLAAGSTQTQAAADAGFAPANAAQQGSRLAGEPQIIRLIELLQMLDILTEAMVTKPALRRVLGGVMENGGHADRVAAARAAMRLEGLDRQRVEITGAVQAIPAEDLRKQLADRLARQRGRTGEL